MKIFITGATGYIGGAIAAKLVTEGYEVRALVRTEKKAELLKKLGIIPIVGDLEDSELLSHEASASDGVINAADSDHRGAVEAFIKGLENSGKPLLHTSGTGLFAKDSGGEFSQKVYGDAGSFRPDPELGDRADIDLLVLNAAKKGIRSVVLCNTNIYGIGEGLHSESIQLPWLINEAVHTGIAHYVGNGENTWSNVHIDDVAELYLLALKDAPAGAWYFVENGETSYKQIVEAVAEKFDLGDARSWSVEETTAQCGPIYSYLFGSNSRVKSSRSRKELNWQPENVSLIDWIKTEAVATEYIQPFQNSKHQ